jgi:hypothetical protein
MTGPAYATAVPVWFDPAVYAFSFTGSIGGGDIDRVTAQAHPAYLSGLQPGREWFAWVDTDATGVVMSSWQGFDLPADAFTGFLAFDEFSSPLSPLAPAMSGIVQADGGVYICISDQGDTDCNRSPGNSPSVDYSFFIALAPLEVPEPDSAFVAGLAVLSLAFQSAVALAPTALKLP